MKRILFGACLFVTAVGLWGCEEFTGCVENSCDGNIANLCIDGVVKTQNCGRVGCNKRTGKCNPLECERNFCNGSVINICLDGMVVLRKDCGLVGCNPLTAGCNSSCTKHACVSNKISNLCIDGVFVENDCGSYGCNPLTGMCNIGEEGGKPGDACNPDVYKQTCINGGANALVCWNNKVTQLDCAGGCEDAGYDPAKPLQVNCKKGGLGGACDRNTYKQTCINGGANALVCWNDIVVQWNCAGGCEDAGYDPAKPLQVKCKNDMPCGCGGSCGSCISGACNRDVYKQTCINGGANALVCWNDKVVQWDCAGGCEDAGYDPAKPLQVNCKKGTTECTNTLANPNNDPTVEGASCDASTYHGACSSDFTKRYYCDKSGVVVQKDCSAGCDPCSLGNNGSKCKDNSGGGSNLTEGGNVGDACDRNVYKQTCINGGANALACWNDKVTQWNCAGGCLDAGYDPARPLQVKCPKDTSGDGDAEICDPATYVPTCESATLGHRCSSSGTVADWTCDKGICTVRTDGTCTKANSNCVDGRYDTEKFVNGFIECVESIRLGWNPEP